MVIVPIASMAEGINKWTDKDGNIHYSQTRPKDTDATKVKVDPLPTGYAGPPIINGERICLSHKCYADKLERQRLERERGYAKARAENEHEASHMENKNETKKSTTTTGNTAYDEYLRSLCRGGSANSTKKDCSDTAKIRQQFEALRPRRKIIYY